MKSIAFFVAMIGAASAFTPQSMIRSSTQLQESLADKIFGMDLFAPNPDVNTYGARKSKNLKQGKLTANSYIPAGLSKTEYEKVRAADRAKKDKNYEKNVKKAFKFQDFDQFYLKRGTDENGAWLKKPGKGHTFAKTKYDYSGSGKAPLADGKKPEAFKFF